MSCPLPVFQLCSPYYLCLIFDFIPIWSRWCKAIFSVLHTSIALFTRTFFFFFFITCIVSFPFMTIYPLCFHIDSINICYGLIGLLILHGVDIHLLGKKGHVGRARGEVEAKS